VWKNTLSAKYLFTHFDACIVPFPLLSFVLHSGLFWQVQNGRKSLQTKNAKKRNQENKDGQKKKYK